MGGIFIIGFPIVMALAYAAYFVFAGFLFVCGGLSTNFWYKNMKKSLFLVGLGCACFDTLIINDIGEGLLTFVAYLGFTIVSSWVAFCFSLIQKVNK